MNKLSHLPTAWRPRRSLLFALAPALVAGAFLTASMAPAQAAPVHVATVSQLSVPTAHGRAHPLTTGVFENYVTGMCMGLSGGHNDSQAVVWKCNGASNQSWSDTFPWAKPQPIYNGNHGQCLGVSGGSTRQGADVMGWRCQPGVANQQWEFGTGPLCQHDYSNNNYFPIYNRETGMVVGVSGASTKEGAHLVMWHLQSGCNNQYWTLI
jgi:hypothetical protein